MNDITELVGGEVQESVLKEYRVSLSSPLNSSRLVCMCMEGFVLVEVDSTVGKLAEGALGLDGSGFDGVL